MTCRLLWSPDPVPSILFSIMINVLVFKMIPLKDCSGVDSSIFLIGLSDSKVFDGGVTVEVSVKVYK